jgi:hypothetical protein
MYMWYTFMILTLKLIFFAFFGNCFGNFSQNMGEFFTHSSGHPEFNQNQCFVITIMIAIVNDFVKFFFTFPILNVLLLSK